MKIVINIPEEYYKTVKEWIDADVELGTAFTAIANGTPLPKGHGRLIDADELKKKTYRIDDSLSLSSRDVIDEEDIDDAPTIIEADKESD